MESQPQNPEFRINPENFHPCKTVEEVIHFRKTMSQFMRFWYLLHRLAVKPHIQSTFFCDIEKRPFVQLYYAQ